MDTVLGLVSDFGTEEKVSVVDGKIVVGAAPESRNITIHIAETPESRRYNALNIASIADYSLSNLNFFIVAVGQEIEKQARLGGSCVFISNVQPIRNAWLKKLEDWGYKVTTLSDNSYCVSWKHLMKEAEKNETSAL